MRPRTFQKSARSALLLSLSWMTACTPAPPTESSPDAPPPETVILVVGCTLRADRTSVHGHTRDTTPYLGRLAEGGAWFTRMIANSGWTRPTIAAITTGIHTVRMGIDDDPRRAISPSFTTLGEHFLDAGWSTAGVTANPNANDVFGFAQGFQQYKGTENLFNQGVVIRPGVDVMDDFIDMIEDVEGPVYGQVVLLDAHAPWSKNYKNQLKNLHIPSKRRRDMYDASLRDLDAALEHLDQRLAEIGRGNRLLVMVGDHGQGLRTPRWAGTGHGTTLYDAHVHVPWVLHGPGVAPNHELGGVAQQLDLVPTLTSLAGLNITTELMGLDLSDEVGGSADRVPEGAAVLSASRARKADELRLTTDEWVLLKVRGEHRRRRDVKHELFALDDTRQANDLTEEHPDVLRRMLLNAELAWRAEDRIKEVVPVNLNAEQNEMLKALGYMDAEEGDDGSDGDE